MSALILQTRSTIANPKYGKIIDLNDGLQFRLDARDLNLSQGDLVNNWSGVGSGTIAERTFNTKLIGWNYPTYDAVSKSVRFSGTNLLVNQLTGVVSLPRATYIVVCKLDDLNVADDKENRIFTGDFGTSAAPSYHSVYPKAGKLKMDTFDSTDGVKLNIDNNWFVGVFVFDGTNSKMITSFDNTLVSNPISAGTQEKISLGGNINRLNPSTSLGMKGNIALFAQYNKALSENEMRSAISYYRNEFSI